VIELTAPQSSAFRVPLHGHGAENAGETKPKFDSHVYRSFAMNKLVSRFIKDESGATAIENGLIAAGIAVAIITAVNGVGTALSSKFGSISTSLK
jgi:pilus assembly protein Flp/PilA